MYICHYCIEYKTSSLSDLTRHFKRKNKCKCSTIMSYDDCKVLSKNKKYEFTFDTNNLSKNDYIYIITHYTDENNIIQKNFKLNNILIKNTDTNLLVDNQEIKEDIKDNNFYCNGCNTSFAKLYNLERHLTTEGLCEKKKKKKELLDYNKQLCNKINKKDELNQNINNTFINNVHNNNVQNINNSNVQNNNNNTQNSTYNVSIRDFVNDSYDLSHINDSYYQKKDFFLYHNFLKMIMENKNNQNIFFSENEAIMYSDNELNKMSSDKAGYLILDKLSQSFDEFLYKQDAEAREYYKFITKYYHVVKGHYKHDTIFKEYDVNEQRFIYTANSNLFRSRDKYLSKMVTTLGKVRGSTLENMSINIDELKDIPMLNPNIEDFASVKMRYRDLKDRD